MEFVGKHIEIITLLGGLLGGGGIVGLLTWLKNRYYKKGVEDAELRGIKVAIGNLPCIENKSNIEENKERIEDRKRKIEEGKRHHDMLSNAYNRSTETLEAISRWIMKQDSEMIDLIAEKKSPYKMTPVGEILFEQSTAKKAIEENTEYLLSALKEIDPRTPYDVEYSALTVLVQNIGHDLFIGIKDFLYNSPREIKIKDYITGQEVSVPLSTQSILKLMSIRLRELYLEKYPEIDTNP